ncbi:T9SS type A sorting domain-containing protein [Fluviicola sp.]|jgi:hypothetical protein|uniref:T9SS type A sorting domain-containing protein n=1 Tax=Fluviicola sp. TaxID=1917219 RepID=UPI00281BCB4D|nr:T9SS type A sorting domain-containing protein [Fluviicola sp.]MDR0802368.1 T9SS type A sorting domain-containing protein [Fluviicola sp.]
MKKIVLFIIGLLFGIFTQAQTIDYQPLHGNYTQYVYRQQSWNGSENVESFHKTIWSGDIVIGGEHYVRIFQYGIYIGGIREDVPNQQRFFIDANNVEKEITINPFLSVGTVLTDTSALLNTFRCYVDMQGICTNCDTFQIAQVDSIPEANGTYSTTYRLEVLPQPNISFSLNSYRGLLNVNGFEFDETQICYREDGAQTAPGESTPWTDMCDLGIEENKLSQIGLFPNPSSEFIRLSGDISVIEQAAVYDLQGILIKEVSTLELNTGISLKELKSGMYFLSFNQNAKVLRFQKI